MNEGWILIHKKILEWEWFDDANTFKVFMYLLLTANWENKKWHGVLIKRGERVVGLNSLSKELKIGVQSIRTSLNHLKSTGELTIKSTNRFSVIQLCNYEKYQSANKLANTPANKQLTNNQQTTNNSKTNIKNNKEIKEERAPASINYLKELPLEDILSFNKDFNCTQTQVKEKAESLFYYCQAKGKTYRNYKAFLRNALAKDFGVRSSTGMQNAVDIIAQKEKELAEERKAYKPSLDDTFYKKIIKSIDDDIPF